MMQRTIQALLLFVSLFIATQCALAQTNDLQFNHLIGSNGITLGKINAITQDKLGFIWLSDQSNRCLVRYDGNHMKRFSYSQGKPNTLGGYYPECLATDPSGAMWVGFYGQGLDRFDPYTNTFTHYSHSDDDPESLSNDMVSAVLVDHLGNLWVGTDVGLNLFDATTGKFKHFKHDPADSTSLSHDVVRSIYEDRQGVLWVGTGIAFIPGDEGGLNRFDRNTGTFTRYMHDPENPNSLVDNKVRAIFEDSYGNFWIGTRGDGIHKMNRETGTFQRFVYNPADPNALSRLPSTGAADHITFITEDTDRKLWFGTLLNGVTRYDPSSGELERFGAETQGFSDNTSWCAFAAPDGHIWLSTQNSNLFRINLYNTVIPYYAGPDYVQAYLQESASVAWIGTDNGLIRENRSGGKRQVFRHDSNNPTSISSNRITAIIKDSKGEFWIGTTNGLNRFDPSTKLFTRYHHDPNDTLSLGDNNIQKIAEDGNGNIWIGTNSSGLNVLERKSGKVHRAFPGYYSVWALEKTGDKYLWVGTPQSGFRMDIKTEEGNFFFDGIGVQCYYPDAKGVLWIGTEHGLYRYDHEEDMFDRAQFTRIDFEGNISSITGDSRGKLWMTSANIGLIRYTPETGQRIIYGKRNNVQLESLAGSTVYQAHDGNLLIGMAMMNGYLKFNPDKIRESQDSSGLYFSSLLLSGIDFTVGDGSIFTGSIFTASNIRLAHDQNTFGLRFTEIDFTNDADTRIYYKLENYDTEWRHSFAEEPASYFQIPPGEYVFKIKASNSQSGRWTERSLAITIVPPWWTTWWAYSVYGLLFVGGVFLVDRVQRKRIINKERALARERELAQAREIEKAYNELKTTQSQLIQSEKMASLGELTAGIAHEIQNPLNFVNNFSEVNTELIEELKAESLKPKAERNEKLEEDLLNDIAENEKKINHHGKRADAIVKGMLQHSRSSSGVKEPTDINVLCDEYLRLAYHGYRAKDKSFNAKFETDFDSSLPKINVVPQDIGRVILNLINNAFYAVSERQKAEGSKYEPNVIVSTIHPSPLERGRGEVTISVKDNGNGISQNIVDKIFQPFFTTKPTGQGTGLGLSLSYDIVMAHGGELTVESSQGEGSTFIIQLPNV
ncbi:MAG: two-component regulator propeller domain-containing protein [Cytophagales bacterium]|nr:two-component regulator propeller domain-containing protein [Cytophagales bacterium]